MYSISSINTLTYANTSWAMWHQQHQHQNRPQIPKYLSDTYQTLNLDSYINQRPLRNEWSVQFFNVHHNLSLYQIHQIFGIFGQISGVVQINRYDRPVYVNYEKEIDAKRCVLGMLQQGIINLRVFPKNRNANPMGNPQNIINVDNYVNLRNFPAVKIDEIHENSSDSFSSNSSSVNTSFENQIKTYLSKKSSGQTPEEFFNKFRGNLSDNLAKSSDNSCKIAQDDFFSSRIQRNGTGEEEKSVLRGNKSEEIEKSRAQEIVQAQEVIVANVPEDFGVFFVLHLLEKFEPICCSEMKTLGKDSVRYCHVYFKSPGDAEAAESDFDNVELAGRHLIVLRAHTLEEEAGKCGLEKCEVS